MDNCFEVGYTFRWKRDNYKSIYRVIDVNDAPSKWGGKEITVVNDNNDEVTMPLGNFIEIKNFKLIKTI